MNIISTLCLFVCLVNFGEFKGLPPLAYMRVPQILSQNGYPFEEYKIKTSDDYILTLYRIPGSRSGNKFNPSLPPVVLVHGMIASSRDFLVMGPNKSLGFLLADAGYDVWMPNMRFNEYATHTTLSKDNPSYWNFNMDDFGGIDIPESIDRVLEITNASKIHYFGYSIGANVYIMMCNIRPDLATKIASFVSAAPAVYLQNQREIVQVMNKLNIMDFFEKAGVYKLIINRNLLKIVVENFCNTKYSRNDICAAILFYGVGEDYEQIDWDRSPAIYYRFQPTSLKQAKQMIQLVETGNFSKFDYGQEENIRRYGIENPPLYNMTANLAPVVVYYSENDKVVTLDDTKKFVNVYRKLNMILSVRKVSWKKFNHIDFIYAKDVNKYFNNDLIKILDYISYKNIGNVTNIKIRNNFL